MTGGSKDASRRLTFLLSDVEGSTRLWEDHPAEMSSALARHDEIFAAVVPKGGGTLVKSRGEGDSTFSVFERAADALKVGLLAQQHLHAEDWPLGAPILVRFAIHTGESELRAGDYYGPTVNRTARLRAIAHGGQTVLSESVLESAGDELPDGVSVRDLGLHRLKDLSGPERVFQLCHPSLPSKFPPLASIDSFPNNLPSQLTSFVGRTRETAATRQLLSTNRLVTLTGVGGTGKTRLALHTATALLESFVDGIWVVELARLSDGALVAEVVADALGVREQRGHPIEETLLEYLRRKQMLLLLDNCEHLLQEVARFADQMLRHAEDLRILTTSREPLGITGEQSYRVPSLELPDVDHRTAIQDNDAVALFIDRARLVKPDFELNQHGDVVAQICRQLDGIPLAIELAAARIQAMTPPQILARLDDRFRLLTGGSRTALERQQTLRATVDWSHELLAEPERTLLRRASVFVGPFTLEAAEAVAVSEELAEEDIADLLGSLVAKSLVTMEEQPYGARYRLNETIRQYSQEKLLEAQEAESLRDRHLQWMADLARLVEPQFRKSATPELLQQTSLENDNLRAAIEWSLSGGDPQLGLRLAGVFGMYWFLHGHGSEGRSFTERLLSAAPDAPPAPRARALHTAGLLARLQGDHSNGKKWAEQAMASAEKAGDPWILSEALRLRGTFALYENELDEATGLLERAMDFSSRLGDDTATRGALGNLGLVALHRGDLVAARRLFEQSVDLCRRVEDHHGLGHGLNNLGLIYWTEGRYEEARAAFEESLASHRVLGDKQGVTHTLPNLLGTAIDLGDLAAAGPLLEEHLAIARDLGSDQLIAVAEMLGGVVALGQGDTDAALVKLQPALQVFRRIRDHQGIASSLSALGHVHMLRGDLDQARSLLQESLAVRREGNDPSESAGLLSLAGLERAAGHIDEASAHFRESLAMMGTNDNPLRIAEALDEAAHLAAARGRPTEAALILGASQQQREKVGASSLPVFASEMEALGADIESKLGASAFQDAVASGRRQAVEELLKSVLI